MRISLLPPKSDYLPKLRSILARTSTLLFLSMLVRYILTLLSKDESSNPSQESPESLRQHHPGKEQQPEQEPNAHQRQKAIRISKEFVDIESEVNSSDSKKQKTGAKSEQENKRAEEKRRFRLRRTQIF